MSTCLSGYDNCAGPNARPGHRFVCAECAKHAPEGMVWDSQRGPNGRWVPVATLIVESLAVERYGNMEPE